jgi:hypothetical protein
VRNEQGNVIAIVLLFLAVVSIAGIGSLMLTRYDMKFSSAYKNYDKSFSLSDGAAVTAYQDLRTHDREQSAVLTDPKHPPAPFIVGCPCVDWTQCKNASTRKTCARCVPVSSGDYLVQLQLMGYSTQPQLSVGWESTG